MSGANLLMSQSIGSKVKTFLKSMMKPSPAAVFQAVKSLKPHVPMIKFRYGGAAGHSGMSAPASPAFAPPASRGGAAPSPGSSAPSKPNATIALPTIEDWQLPARYQRRPMDATEIDYINRGGPE